MLPVLNYYGYLEVADLRDLKAADIKLWSPLLKYQRLGSDVTDILAADSARCLGVHEKFLILGTSSGAKLMHEATFEQASEQAAREGVPQVRCTFWT